MITGHVTGMATAETLGSDCADCGPRDGTHHLSSFCDDSSRARFFVRDPKASCSSRRARGLAGGAVSTLLERACMSGK